MPKVIQNPSTVILQELKKRELSVYKLIQLMDKHPRNDYALWHGKLKGAVWMSFDEIEKMCKVISKETKYPLVPEDLQWKNKHVYMT